MQAKMAASGDHSMDSDHSADPQALPAGRPFTSEVIMKTKSAAKGKNLRPDVEGVPKGPIISGGYTVQTKTDAATPATANSPNPLGPLDIN